MPRPTATKARPEAASAPPLPRPDNAPSLAAPAPAPAQQPARGAQLADVEGEPGAAPLELSPVHAVLADDTRGALEDLTQLLEMLRATRLELERYRASEGGAAGLAMLSHLERLAWGLADDIRRISATLTGLSEEDSVGGHIGTLGRLSGYAVNVDVRRHDLSCALAAFNSP